MGLPGREHANGPAAARNGLAIHTPSPDPGRWARITEIVGQAVDLHGEARVRFLRDACGTDADLRAAVDSLLAAHAGGGILAELPDEPVGSAVSPEVVGPYRIVHRLGDGGMGSVYLAVRQGPGFTQRVALKLMRAGFVDPVVAARLGIEQQILARLEHPNIARFIDGGTTAAGQPYVAMEYVEGTNVVRYCDEHGCSVSQTLELFILICEAVHYAHQQLIVHRDLKPSNILVTADGHPRLLDFGIAKLLDPDLEPHHHSRSATWCTPAYASPEQVRGEAVTTLSDVYSLGVMLYELLTGRRPYRVDDRSPAEMARVVSEVEATRPSAVVDSPRLKRLLAGDLDTIVLKALEKEARRRYGSARELADDLRRYLQREPVQARPARLGYRLSKFVGRNRVSVIAGVVIAASMLAGLLAASWQASVAQRERVRAEAERRQSQGVTDFVIGLFSSDDPSVDIVAKRAMLEQGIREAEDLAGQPDAHAAAVDALAQAFWNLGLYPEAAALSTRAYEIQRRQHPDGHPDVAASLTRLAGAVERVGNPDSTERLYRAALAMARRFTPEADPIQLDALLNLGRRARGDGRLGEADSILRLAMAFSTRTFGPEAESTLNVMHQVAMAARSGGDLAKADSVFRRMIEIRRRTLGPQHPRVAASMFFHGDVLRELGQTDSAEATYRAALGILERAAGPDAVGLVHGLHSLGALLADRGEADEAVAVAQRATRILTARYGAHNITTARGKENLAGVLRSVGRFAEAESLYREVLDEKIKALGEWTVPQVLMALSDLARRRGDLDAAAAYAERCLRIRLETDPKPGILSSTLVWLADVEGARGSLARAEELLREAAALTQTLPADDPARRDALRALARFLQETGRPEEAAQYRARVGAEGG